MASMLRLNAIPIILVFIAAASCGPVQVRVEQDNKKSFDVGPQARSTFELVEEYHPLSTAYNQQNRPRALSSSLSKGPARRVSSPAQILVDFGSPTVEGNNNTNSINQQQHGRYESDKLKTLNTVPAHVDNANNENATPLKSHWLEWTRWSACANGERVRIRQRLEANNVRCEGESVQRQNCFQSQSQVPVAKDPLVIEKEILGVESPLRKS